MMKIIFAVLFTVFVVGPIVDGNIIRSRQYYYGASTDGIKDIAQEAINKLKKLITDTINNALNSLENLEKELLAKFEEMKQKVMDAAKEQIDKIMGDLEKEIAEWKKKAEELGVDVKECYYESEQQLEQLPGLALDKMLSCITDEFNSAMSIINGTKKIITDAIQQVNDLETKFHSCTTIGCYTDVISKCAGLTISLVTDIGKKVTEVTTFVAGLKTRVEVCAATQVTSLATEAAKIAKGVVDCIVNKITTFEYLLAQGNMRRSY